MALNFPPNPKEGDTHFDPSNGVTYTYKNGGWVASGGTQDDLDLRYVLVAGDNMTGDLTLGTDKITIDASNGFINQGTSVGDFKLTIYQNNVIENSYGFGIGSGELIYQSGGAHSFRNKNNEVAAIGSDGSITAAGRIQSTSQGTSDRSEFINKTGDGGIRVSGSGPGSDSGILLSNNYDNSVEDKWSIKLNGTGSGTGFTEDSLLIVGLDGSKTTEFKQDGSIFAAGDVLIGTTGSYTPSTPAISLTADGTGTFTTSSNNPIVCSSSTAACNIVFTDVNSTANCAIGAEANNIRFQCGNSERLRLTSTGSLLVGDQIFDQTRIALNADGSITAAGAIESGEKFEVLNSAGTEVRVKLFKRANDNYGTLETRSNTDTGDFLIAYNATGTAVVMANDGSITAAGPIETTSGVANQSVSLFPNGGSVWERSVTDKDSNFIRCNAAGTEVIRFACDGSGKFAKGLNINGAPAAANVSLAVAATDASPNGLRINCETSASETAALIQSTDSSGVVQVIVRNQGNILLGDVNAAASTANIILSSKAGSAEFAGTVTADNVTFNLEADDDTKYTATTSEDGEQTLVYNGAVLDVKDRLTKLDTALTGLKAALVSTTDHASLKTALIAALADI